MPKIFCPVKILKIFAPVMVWAAFFAVGAAAKEEPEIDGADLYLINVSVPRHFSFGDWNSR